jgi:hypothetical protein
MLGSLQSENLLPRREGNDKRVYSSAANSLQNIFGFFKAKPEEFNLA